MTEKGQPEAVKTTPATVRIPDELLEAVRTRWPKLGMTSFTDYVMSLIKSDLQERPILIRSEDGMVFATHFTRAPSSIAGDEKPKKRNRPGIITPPDRDQGEDRKAQ